MSYNSNRIRNVYGYCSFLVFEPVIILKLEYITNYRYELDFFLYKLSFVSQGLL